MKSLFYFCFIVISSMSLAQEFNNTVIDSASGKPMLVGNCTLEAFTDTSFNWWWNSNYNMYDVDLNSVDSFSDKLSDIDITIVMGTWCSDSRREVPRFIKILEEASYDLEKLKIISVNRDKQCKDIDIKNLKIELVPTMIFYQNGEELGRIVESPQQTLETDILKIVTG